MELPRRTIKNITGVFINPLGDWSAFYDTFSIYWFVINTMKNKDFVIINTFNTFWYKVKFISYGQGLILCRYKVIFWQNIRYIFFFILPWLYYKNLKIITAFPNFLRYYFKNETKCLQSVNYNSSNYNSEIFHCFSQRKTHHIKFIVFILLMKIM